MEYLPLAIFFLSLLTESGNRRFNERTHYRWFVFQGSISAAANEMIRLFIPIAGTWGFIAYTRYEQPWLIQPREYLWHHRYGLPYYPGQLRLDAGRAVALRSTLVFGRGRAPAETPSRAAVLATAASGSGHRESIGGQDGSGSMGGQGLGGHRAWAVLEGLLSPCCILRGDDVVRPRPVAPTQMAPQQAAPIQVASQAAAPRRCDGRRPAAPAHSNSDIHLYVTPFSDRRGCQLNSIPPLSGFNTTAPQPPRGRGRRAGRPQDLFYPTRLPTPSSV